MTNRIYRRKKAERVGAVLLAAALTGILSALIADTLKVMTEHYQEMFFHQMHLNRYLIFLLPLVGLATIHLLRKYLFKNKTNKGIKEVLDTINKNDFTLPSYKIPSHYFNGFLTVIFGGSTGIEVSTVVATASVGALSSRKVNFLRKYRTDLVCAGLAAGVTALFNAPIAGFLFAFEVFTQRKSKLHSASVITAVLASYLLTRFFFFNQIFNFQVSGWQQHAFPYFILLGILAGFYSVYLTRSVLFFKNYFAALPKTYVKIGLGALIISSTIFFFPSLYGEGYAGIRDLTKLTTQSAMLVMASLLMILALKPIITSVTLGAGGDGGVFAPSLFMGAFLGLIMATLLNHFFHLNVIPVNFMLIGMAAVLSGSIHAPLTAIFLVCAIADNYLLFIPIVIACLVAKVVAHSVFPYTVYTYKAVSK